MEPSNPLDFTHRPSQDFTSHPSQFAPEAPLLVSCIRCKQLHTAEDPLEFNPVCPACASQPALDSLEMRGSYPLTDESIDATLTRKAPGNYALGYMEDDAFTVFYVGRSDSDVKDRLHEWVGQPSRYDAYAPPALASWDVGQRGASPLNAPTLGRVGNGDSSYTRFAYSYAASAEAAYAKEWRNYEAFGGSHSLDNDTPPASTDR